MVICGTHLGPTPQEVSKKSIRKISLQKYLLTKLLSHISGAND